MDNFGFIVLGLVVAFFLYSLLGTKKIINRCALHIWVYKNQPGTTVEFLQCEICGFLPGSDDGSEL